MCLFRKNILKYGKPEKFTNKYYQETNINTKNTDEKGSERVYTKKRLITSNEEVFLKNLISATKNQYIIQAQINLASIIEKTSNEKYQNELYRNVDFGIFDKNLFPLLLIELNDSSHKNFNRHQRDIKVRDICEKAGIPIVTFYSNMPNRVDYIENRLKTLLQ
jgi:hypothetical protein